MSYIKEQLLETMELPQLTMTDISLMYIEDIVKRAKQVEFFNGREWLRDSDMLLSDAKFSIMWSIGANKIEILSEQDDHIIIKDNFEKDLTKQILKFSI